MGKRSQGWGVTECSARCTKEEPAALWLLPCCSCCARALRVGPGRVLLTLRKPGTPCQLAGILEGVLQL